jgi:hypothetical protein
LCSGQTGQPQGIAPTKYLKKQKDMIE